MKVLWFTNTPALAQHKLAGTGISGSWLQALNKELQERVELHIAFYFRGSHEWFQYEHTHYYPISLQTGRLKQLKDAMGNKVRDAGDLPEFQRIIDAVQPDIIHIHGTENAFTALLGRTTVPTVVSIQGILSACYRKFDGGFTDSELKYIPAGRKNSWKRKLTRNHFYTQREQFAQRALREKNDMRNCRYVIGRTEWDKAWMRVLAPGAAYAHNDEMLRDGFYSGRWDKLYETGKLVIHSTGGSMPYKGLLTICRALFLLQQRGIQVKWQVAGLKREDDILIMIRRKMGDSFPEESIVPLGNLSEDALITAMTDAHLFVSASHIDNSPNGVCEAMMLGMPVIATYVGGTPSMLNHGSEGVLIQDGDPEALAGSIMGMISDRETMKGFGERARERALKRHDKQRISDELLAIYNGILNQKSP